MTASNQTPIYAAHLFTKIDALLIDLLQSLTDAEWQMPTVAKHWCVKDVAAHLLDGNLRTLSIQRDKYFGEIPADIDSYQNLVAWLNQLNATWVAASKRLSPQVLILLLQSTRPFVSDYYAALNPNDTAIFSVAWAGESESKNWLHLAREYTEKLIHQQQIRDAVGKSGLITEQFYLPFIQIIMLALPHTYKNVIADDGTLIKVTISPIGGSYYLLKSKNEWQLSSFINIIPTAEITIDSNIAWQLFSGSLGIKAAQKQVIITGNASLAIIALSMRSFMV